VTEVADAEFERLLTGTAFARLARRSLEKSQYGTTDTEAELTRYTYHSDIESSIGEGCSVVVNVIEHALGNLQHALVDDILVGPGKGSGQNAENAFDTTCDTARHSLDAKLDSLEALG
jgi:hypothetical protein